MSTLIIEEIGDDDFWEIWLIIEPVVRAGDSYALPRDLTFHEARAMWAETGRRVFMLREGGSVFGTYYLRPAQLGPGAHVANAGFMTAPHARGKGVAREMGEHALATARAQGYKAMQFNAVVSVNAPAVALWTSLGFEIIGRAPEAYDHPRDGFVDLLIMYRKL